MHLESHYFHDGGSRLQAPIWDCFTNYIVEQFHEKLKFLKHPFMCSRNSNFFLEWSWVVSDSKRKKKQEQPYGDGTSYCDAERAMLFLSGRTGVHEYLPVHATALHASMFVIVATNGWNSTIMEPRESAAIVQLNAIPHCTFVREDPLANKFSNIQNI